MQRSRGSGPGLTLGGRRYSRRFLTIAGIALLFVVGAIAGGGGGNNAEPTATTVAPTEAPEPTEEREPTEEPEPTDAPTEEPAAESRCEPVDNVLIGAIGEGLTVDGGGSLRNVQAVQSGDFESAYFVVADLQGEGLEGANDIGIWVTNDLAAPTSIYAVDEMAKEFSDWGDGGQTDAGFSTSDDGAQEAKECVEAAGG